MTRRAASSTRARSRWAWRGTFSGLSGSRYELGTRYDWSWQGWEFAVHLRGEINDSDDELFATRWAELGATAQYSFSPRWSLVAGSTLRRTRHPEIEDVEAARSDRRSTLRLGTTAKYWRSAQLFVRVEHERNDSAVDFYEYDRNWIAASLEAWY